jgi:hypothetical protein
LKKVTLITALVITLATASYFLLRVEEDRRGNSALVKKRTIRVFDSNKKGGGNNLSRGNDKKQAAYALKSTSTHPKRDLANISFSKKNVSDLATKISNYFDSAKAITINQQEYLVSTELAVTPTNRYRESKGEKVLNIYGQTLFMPIDFNSGWPVLLNRHTHGIAVTTGRMNIKADSKAIVQNLELPDGAVIDDTMSHLSIYSISIPLGHDLIELQEQLASNEQIDVELEVIEEVAHAK